MKLHTSLALIGALGLGATLYFGQASTAAADPNAQETYFASGQIESRVRYEDGRREGQAERFYRDGSKQSAGRYVDGRMEGAWQFWNADGSIDTERTGTYQGGSQVLSEAGAAGS